MCSAHASQRRCLMTTAPLFRVTSATSGPVDTRTPSQCPTVPGICRLARLHARVAHPFGRTVHIVFEWQLDPPPVLRQSFSDGFEHGMSG